MQKSTMLWILGAAVLIIALGAHRENQPLSPGVKAMLARDACEDQLKEWRADHGSFEGAQILKGACKKLQAELDATYSR